MPIKKVKPTSPGRRFITFADFAEITKTEPEKSLTVGLTKSGGRNNNGRKTSRHRGGGAKRAYRIVDFKRRKLGVTGTIERLEYDPNRTAFIALVKYEDGELSYILAPQRLKAGDIVVSGERVDVKPGNAMPLKNIPVGTIVHAIELRPGGGAKIARSAGTSVQLLAKEGTFAHLRMPSGEIRLVESACRATVGQVGNAEWELINWGKAGRTRYKGRRPHVRGVVMNPVDHPLGGGEGKSSGGRHPTSPWGKKEGRTRKRKPSDRLIQRRRKSKKKG